MNARAFKINQKSWCCSEKTKFRDCCIIQSYRESFNKKALPINKQYWSMCGQCLTESGEVIENSELDQVISSGLVQPSQFFGVDISKEIYNTNKQYTSSNWIHGDIFEVMLEYSREHTFNPGIINYDTVRSTAHITNTLGKIMNLINVLNIQEVSIVCNSIWSYRKIQIPLPEIFNVLMKDILVKGNYNEDWSCTDIYYYRGEKSKAKMCAIAFMKLPKS